MQKKIIILLFIVSLMGCNKSSKIHICDDRHSNSIANELLTDYLSNKKLEKVQFFIMRVSNKNDSVKILIYPIIQKNDSRSFLPSSYFTYCNKKIFMLNNVVSNLPKEQNSKALIELRKAVKCVPEYPNDYKYPRWKILIKDGRYVIDSTSIITIQFSPPVHAKDVP